MQSQQSSPILQDMTGVKEKTPRQKGILKILVLHTQTLLREETLQPAEFSKAMDDHVLQLVLQAGEGTVGMLPQR